MATRVGCLKVTATDEVDCPGSREQAAGVARPFAIGKRSYESCLHADQGHC